MSIPGMQSFNHFPAQDSAPAKFVVLSPLGTRFTGFKTWDDAFQFSASLKGGHWQEIEARIQPVSA